jgi:Kef-type K+ transport system membrane component KefB
VDHGPLSLLDDIGWAIVFAAVAAHLARLARQPMLLGYVLGGVVLGGQIGLGLVTQAESIELISEIGLIFLLFIIGLEVDLREVAQLGKATFVVGIAQFFGCVALGMALFAPLALDGGPFWLLYLAIGAALSSTLVVVKLLHDKAEIHTAAGRLTIGILVLQDLFAIVFMALQPSLADPSAAVILRAIGLGAALVAATFLASRYVLSHVLRAVAKLPELVLVSALGWCFAICGLASAVGLSREVGALVAGLSIATFPYGTDVVAKVAGVRDFFVTLFFVSLGLKLPVPDGAMIATAAYMVGVVLVTSILTVVPAAWALRLGARTGAVTALNLSQISEFSLVILALGVGYGHVDASLQNTVLASMLLAALVSTYAITYNDRIARAIVRVVHAVVPPSPDAEAEADAGRRHAAAGHDIVLLGCFREGRELLERLECELPAARSRVLVIDFNLDLQQPLGAAGFAFEYGDLAHPDTLHHLGLAHAKLVISSVPDSFLRGTSNLELLHHARQIAPNARFIGTAESVEAEEALRDAGACLVIRPAQLVAARLLDEVKSVVRGVAQARPRAA